MPENVRQTFKHRFVPKLIGIVSLSILIVYGRVNHRTQRRFVLAAELSETSKQGKTKSLLTPLQSQVEKNGEGGTGTPGPPPPSYAPASPVQLSCCRVLKLFSVGLKPV